MMRFNVEIYNYSTGTSTTYTIGGYNYSDGNWYNVFAYANRQGTTGHGNLTVRFGHNGTNSIIWIGESNTSYSYPKVRIPNVTLGHSNPDYNTWAAGWSVTIATTAPTNVSQTVTNPATNYYAESAGSVAWGNVTGKSIGLVIVNKNNGTSSVYSSINFAGCLTASASGSGGTRRITVTNNSSKLVNIACSVSSVYPAKSDEFGWAHFTSSPSTSISANSSEIFNISFGYIHCQGSSGDYVQRGPGGYIFSCIAFYED